MKIIYQKDCTATVLCPAQFFPFNYFYLFDWYVQKIKLRLRKNRINHAKNSNKFPFFCCPPPIGVILALQSERTQDTIPSSFLINRIWLYCESALAHTVQCQKDRTFSHWIFIRIGNLQVWRRFVSFNSVIVVICCPIFSLPLSSFALAICLSQSATVAVAAQTILSELIETRTLYSICRIPLFPLAHLHLSFFHYNGAELFRFIRTNNFSRLWLLLHASSIVAWCGDG